MTRGPSHAGRLRPFERGIFTLLFTFMASFVVFVGFLASTASGHLLLLGPPVPGLTIPAGLSQQKAGFGQFQQESGTSHAGGRSVQLPTRPDAQLNAELATVLQPVIGADRGRLAVGIIDVTTGASATYNSATPLRDGGLVTADILAVLLLQHQQADTPVSTHEAELAEAMMQDGSGTATAQLLSIIGGAAGLSAGNTALKLTDTTLMHGDNWMWARTTAADQLQLLVDLTAAQSPLKPAARDYALGLMTRDATAPTWDVLAAATPGAPGATADGSLVGPRWVIGSIGVVQRNGHELLIAVLSDRNPAEHPALAAARSAALAAASLFS
ncbi:MAG: hypothetical protein J2P28_15195 [Actinobacteria bacterium]|nr:hypothetical protein [Actinomycetota bacterium]MBO0836834.1 hypothetical protein [Actinomycetota bacterium]